MAEWIGGNRYLTQSEMENNALIFYGWMYNRGATLNAVAAMLGNMQTESTINPNIWEELTPNPSRGYGLTQWTPSTKLSNWNPNYTDGNVQCERIWWEALNNQQWFHNPGAPIYEPPISFMQFMHSTGNVRTLANYFLWYYEHPAETIQPKRAEQAVRWYEFLSGEVPPDPPGPTPGSKIEVKPMKFIYNLRKF